MGEGPPPEDFDYGDRREDGQFERHPTVDEGEFVQPVRSTYIHTDGCGESTRMWPNLAESFARDPHQYGKTFCASCQDYFDLTQFTWEGTDQRLDEVGNPEAPEDLPDHLDPCPQCDEFVSRGSVRWNGFAWEHKGSETHPQAGHHIMDPEALEEPEADADPDHEDPRQVIDAAADQYDVDLDEAITAIDPAGESSRIYILEELADGDYRVISMGLDGNGKPQPTEKPMHIPKPAISGVQALFQAAGMQRATNMLADDGEHRSLRDVSEGMGISEPYLGDQ